MGSWQKGALLIAVLAAGCVQSDLAPGVSPSAIKAVRLGMNVDEVINTLGVPYSIVELHCAHSSTCRTKVPCRDRAVTSGNQLRALLDSADTATPCFAAIQQALSEGHFVLIYSRMVQEYGINPMLYVFFHERTQVRAVTASIKSRIPGRDEPKVYSLNGHGLFCKEELLQMYFSQ